MEEKEIEKADATSIKPVSSLLSHFEQLNKPASEATSSAAQSRSQSPNPKATPSRFNSPAPATRTQRPPSPTKPKANGITRLSSPDGSRSRPMSMIQQRTDTRSPSVHVEPPSSPAKNTNLHITTPNPSDFLQGERAAQGTSTGRTFKIPSRPTTPKYEKSPLLTPTTHNLPPEPPPPRRSGEFRREPSVPPNPLGRQPPPINRSEKPKIPAKPQHVEPSRPVERPVEPPRPVKSATPDKPESPFVTPPTPSPFDTPPTASDAFPPPPLQRSHTVRAVSPRGHPPPRPTIPARPFTNDRSLGRANTVQYGSSPHSNGFRRPPIDTGRMVQPPPQMAVNTPRLAKPPALPARPVAQIPFPPPPSRPSVEAAKLQRQNTTPTTVRQTNTSFGHAHGDHGVEAVSTLVPTQKRNVSTPMSHNLDMPSPSHSRSLTIDHTGNRNLAQPRLQPRKSAEVLESSRSSSAILAPQTETPQCTDLPDPSMINRRPPYPAKNFEIATNATARIFDVVGNYVCTSGSFTRAWDVATGQQILNVAHAENIKINAIAFKWAAQPEKEGQKIWCGSTTGDLIEVDLTMHSVALTKPEAHGRNSIVKIFRQKDAMWTLDEAGTMHVWAPDQLGNLTFGEPAQTHRLPKGHTCSIIVGNDLWYANGRDIRVYQPNLSPTQALLTPRALVEPTVGDALTCTIINNQPDRMYFGHTEGRVSVWDRKSYVCIGVHAMDPFKANALVGIGNYLWAGYSSGFIRVYDTTQTPWVVKKEWKAHNGPVVGIKVDKSYAWRQDQLQVVSLGTDNILKSWDGLLREDWLENDLQSRDGEYCSFEQIRTMVFTWNCGASTPHSLRYAEQDSTFMRDLLQSSGAPDIMVFGFQELVDLEDKKQSAKAFFKSKKKNDQTNEERMSHQYRDWRDFLIRSLDDFMPKEDLYHLLQSSTLVGLFTCIFVKSHLRDRIKNLSATEVKRGMGGYHGNKGALVIRFTLDDSSLCFVNCHLAAGQSHAKQRHADIAAILAGDIFPPERQPTTRLDSLIGGGDGSMILDHELCIWNGDLNYRIDTMSRDAVVIAVKQGNLDKLLERDQLLVSRRKKQDFPLRMFTEMPITFAPTYKYDVGTDTYDTSEKKRAPAWCDRILYRDGGNRGRIKQLWYNRHEVRVSDHRPVSAGFEMRVKRIDPERRSRVWESGVRRFERVRGELLRPPAL